MQNTISDTGLSVVYSPGEDTQIVDIVIVHGLQGHPYRTWASTKNPKGPASSDQGFSKEPKDASEGHGRLFKRIKKGFKRQKNAHESNTMGDHLSHPSDTKFDNAEGDFVPVFWPAHLAPKECPKSRILVYGYDTKVSKYYKGPTNQNHILSHGKDLLYALCRERTLDRPVVFLAHSLGGIVVKEALAASSTSADPRVGNVVSSTAAVIFLGTPHRGSPDLSALGEWARSVLSVFRMDTTSAILDTLGLKTADLERAQEAFSGLWQRYDFRVKTFQEGLGLTGIHLGVLGNKVVPNYSSAIGDQREQAETLQANHMDMCRFTGEDDPNYRKVAGELRAIYVSIQELSNRKIHQDGRILREPLITMPVSLDDADEVESLGSVVDRLQMLKFPTMNLRHRSLARPTDNTCNWLFQLAKYQDWFQNQNQEVSRGLLRLNGKPGAGKSVLIKEAFRRVSLAQPNSDYLTAAFFFSAQGQQLEHSSTGMFRSLLHQLLPSHQDHLRLSDSLWDDENLPLLEQDLEASFKLLFSRPSMKRTIVFIDALDECDEKTRRSVAHFWRDITTNAYASGAKLSVLISSRHFPTINLSDCPVITVENHNQGDIEKYVDQKIKLVAASEDEWSLFKSLVLERSAGVFLWVVLVVEKLLEGYDEGEGSSAMKRHIEQLPAEIEKLFLHILVFVDAESAHQTYQLFQWATLRVVPLRLHEWHHVLAFIKGPFRSLDAWRESRYFTENDMQLERQIKTLSRGLLEVRTVPFIQDDSLEQMSTRAGAGSLDLTHGETRVVEFIHESAREFFLCGRGLSWLNPNEKEVHLRAKGHMSIMMTCLNYLDIAELDALVAARKRSIQFTSPKSADLPKDEVPATRTNKTNREDHRQGPAAATNNTNFILPPAGFVQNVDSIQRRQDIERPLPTPKALALEKSHNNSVFEWLRGSLTATYEIDVSRWVATNLVATRQGALSDSSRGLTSHLSTNASTHLLEDYPALLSYATYELFSHAKLAQAEGANPAAIVDHMQRTGSWDRWRLLTDAVPSQIGLRDFVIDYGLESWLPCIDSSPSEPGQPIVPDQGPPPIHCELGQQFATPSHGLKRRRSVTSSVASFGSASSHNGLGM